MTKARWAIRLRNTGAEIRRDPLQLSELEWFLVDGLWKWEYEIVDSECANACRCQTTYFSCSTFTTAEKLLIQEGYDRG